MPWFHVQLLYATQQLHMKIAHETMALDRRLGSEERTLQQTDTSPTAYFKERVHTTHLTSSHLTSPQLSLPPANGGRAL